jgi:hypothetical protein
MLKKTGIDIVRKKDFIDSGVSRNPIQREGIMRRTCARVKPVATPIAPQRTPTRNEITRKLQYITAHQNRRVVFL